jgi:ElaB/YqjD/DUF883 family membrane-anchored ribosome-binding protein
MNRSNIDETQSTQAESGGGASEHGRRSSRDRGAREQEPATHEGHGVDIERLREAGRNLGSQLEEQMVRRPYVVVGAAAGIGFVAGSLFGSRLGQMILAVGVGYAAKNVLASSGGLEKIRSGIDKLAETLDAD